MVANLNQPAFSSNKKLQLFFPLQAAPAIKQTLRSQVSASDVELVDQEPT